MKVYQTTFLKVKMKNDFDILIQRFRTVLCAFLEDTVAPWCEEWRSGELPKSFTIKRG